MFALRPPKKKQRTIAALLYNNLGSGRNIFDQAGFVAQLQNSLVLQRGTGSPTFTRATTGTVSDNEGILRTAIAGEARFVGARRVYNQIPAAGTGSASLAVAAAKTMTLTAGTYIFSMGAGTGTATFSGTGGATGTLVASASVRTSVVKTVTAGTFIVTASVATLVDLQTEDITGRTDQTTPSEYVSVGVLSTPYHGAGVDGVKYFNTDLTGAAIPAATNLGYLAEGAATQILPTADIRDMTTAGWTLGATMTRARTSVGADGAANSATRITGGAVAATNTCYTTIVAAASSRTYSALVKRVTGTGPVRIVQTGTETDISTQLATTGYALVQLNASILNAVMGFKIDTNGDAIDVDFNQFEAGAFATSRMVTTGAARNTDVLTYPFTSNFSKTIGSLSLEHSEASGGGTGAYSFNTDAGSQLLRWQATTTLQSFDGTNNPTLLTVAARTANVMYKNAMSWSGVLQTGAENGVVGTPQTFDGTFETTTSMYIGNNSGGTTPINGNIKNVRIWTRALSSSELKAITT